MRFSLIELLLITAVAALAIVSLKMTTPFWESLFFSFTLAMILVSILMGIGRRAGARAFWMGFAITSSLYLVLAHIPDCNGTSPREDGPELTTQLLRAAYNVLHSRDLDTSFSRSQSGGVFSIDDNPFPASAPSQLDAGATDKPAHSSDALHGIEKNAAPFPANLSLRIISRQEVMDNELSQFMRIGHCAWALLLGWLGGHFARFVYARSRRG